MLAIFSTALRWLISTAQIKAVFIGLLTIIGTTLVSVVQSYLAPYLDTTALSNAFLSIDPSIWYFIDLLNIPFGFQTILVAMSVRFIIRRLPVIG